MKRLNTWKRNLGLLIPTACLALSCAAPSSYWKAVDDFLLFYAQFEAPSSADPENEYLRSVDKSQLHLDRLVKMISRPDDPFNPLDEKEKVIFLARIQEDFERYHDALVRAGKVCNKRFEILKIGKNVMNAKMKCILLSECLKQI